MCLTKFTLLLFLGTRLYTTKNVFYQDKESEIKMEKNRRNPCTVNSRHISVRYFFVEYPVDKEELSID